MLDTLGWMLVEQGNTTRGLPLLQKAVSTVPEAVAIRYHLVLGLVKLGDKAKARKEWNRFWPLEKLFPKLRKQKLC